MFRVLIGILILFAPALNAYAAEKTAVPTVDLKGAKDTPFIGRYQGSFIVS
jgi:hypothetical protein